MLTTDHSINRLLWLTYIAYLLLFTSISINAYLVWENFWVAWPLQVVPLLLLLPGILQKHYRTYSWLCFLMLMYFASYAVQVYSPSRDVWDWLGLTLSVTLFISGMFNSRQLQRYTKGC